MQINKSKKRAKKYLSSSSFDSDFSAGFEDGRFDRFKPVFKVFIVIGLVVAVVWGVSAYFGSTDKIDDINKVDVYNPSRKTESDDMKLSSCISEANSQNPTLDTTDPGFYAKLIAGYDAQLVCYDKFPDGHSANSRSSVELARENAIDSSGDYKDAYLLTNSYEYIPSTSSIYNQSNSHNSPSQSPGSSTSGSGSSSEGSNQQAMDTRWCSSKKAEVDRLYMSYQDARTNYQVARDKVDAIDSSLRSVSTSRPPGFSGTQNQLDSWRDSERRRLNAERAPLASKLSSAESIYNSASTNYLNTQREYVSRSC